MTGDAADWFLWALAPTPAARLTKKKIARVLTTRRIRRIAAADALALLQQPALTVAPGTTTAAKAHIATAAERARLVNRQLKEVIRRLDVLVDQLAGPRPGEAVRRLSVAFMPPTAANRRPLGQYVSPVRKVTADAVAIQRHCVALITASSAAPEQDCGTAVGRRPLAAASMPDAVANERVPQLVRALRDLSVPSGVHPLVGRRDRHDALAQVLMHPDDRVPNAMVDALYYVDELANDQGMDRLMDEAAAAGIRFDLGADPTSADVAIAAWLTTPELLRRVHAETYALRQKKFVLRQSRSAAPGRSRHGTTLSSPASKITSTTGSRHGSAAATVA